MNARVVLAAAGLLVLVTVLAPAAQAYTLYPFKWCNASPSTPRTVTVWNSMDGDYYQPGETGWHVWAAGMSAVRYAQAASQATADVDMSVGYHGPTGWSGLTTTGSIGGCITHSHIDLNTYYVSNPLTYGYDKLAGVVAHEMGHAQGLNHSASPDALMYAGDNWGSRPYIAPVRDDINGISALYGGTLRNKWPVSSLAGGWVTRDANGNPTKVEVTTAGTNRFAFASTTDDTVPTTARVMLVQVSLNPSPLYRTSICVCGVTDPTLQWARAYDLEVNNDRFVVTYTKSDNTLGSVPMQLGGSTPVPTAGIAYYSTLVVYNKVPQGPLYFRAYVERASDAVEIASASGSGTRYVVNGIENFVVGPAVWTDVSGNPLSAATLGSGWSGWA